MTQDEICVVVCECLTEIGIAPSETQAECESRSTTELGLEPEDVSALLLCVKGKLKGRGCIAVIGPSDWERAKTVKQFCGFVYAKHTCD